MDVAIDGAIFGSSALLGVTPARLLSGLAARAQPHYSRRRTSLVATGHPAHSLLCVPSVLTVVAFNCGTQLVSDSALFVPGTPFHPPLCGTARCAAQADLKVDPRRASQIAEGAVAFRLRGILLDAIGARRRGDTNEELRTLHEQGLVLRALPLAPDAAQLDLIASSLRTRSTPAEREALVAEYAAVHGNDLTVELVRAALGVQVGGDGEAEGAQ